MGLPGPPRPPGCSSHGHGLSPRPPQRGGGGVLDTCEFAQGLLSAKGAFCCGGQSCGCVGTRPCGHTEGQGSAHGETRVCGPRRKVGACETALRSQNFLVAGSRVLPSRGPGEQLTASCHGAGQRGRAHARAWTAPLLGGLTLAPGGIGVSSLPSRVCGLSPETHVKLGAWHRMGTSSVCTPGGGREAPGTQTRVLSPRAPAANMGPPWAASSPVG